jgi:hypothetical protein
MPANKGFENCSQNFCFQGTNATYTHRLDLCAFLHRFLATSLKREQREADTIHIPADTRNAGVFDRFPLPC